MPTLFDGHRGRRDARRAAAVPLLRADLRAERAVAAGALLTLIPRFDPGKALEIIQRDRVTVFEGVPTMYRAMLNDPDREQYDVSSLRLCVSGGAAMPVEVMRGFEEAFGCKILEGYGLSETSPVASFNHPTASASRARSARRSRASRCAWSTTTATTSRRARSARSPSAATTS